MWQGRYGVGGKRRADPRRRPKAQQCGRLRAKYALSWQVIPRIMGKLMISDKNLAKSGIAMTAMLNMKTIDIAELKRAHAG